MTFLITNASLTDADVKPLALNAITNESRPGNAMGFAQLTGAIGVRFPNIAQEATNMARPWWDGMEAMVEENLRNDNDGNSR